MGFAKKALNLADGRWIGQSVLGKKAASSIDLAGQIVGDYDKLYKPAAVAPIPNLNTPAASYDAADIARRLAKKANGIDSTIRTSPAGALYSAQPKQLLGS